MGGLEGAHDGPVADWQEGKVRTVELADELHVTENGGVACVVEPEATIELQDITYGITSVDNGSILLRDAGGVEGMGRSDLDSTNLLGGRALHNWHPVLDPLALEIGEDLEVRHYGRSGLLREGYDVVEVIEVPVGDEDRVELPDLLEVLRGLGIISQPGVYDDLLASWSCKPEGRMPKVGDPGPAKHLVHN